MIVSQNWLHLRARLTGTTFAFPVKAGVMPCWQSRMPFWVGGRWGQ